MGWKILLIGDDFDLQELEKSFRDSDILKIVKEKDGYFFISTEFDQCKSRSEVKNQALSILDILNGAKTLALGSNTPLKLGYLVREKADGTLEIIEETHDIITATDSASIIEKDSESKIAKEIHPADDVPKWLTFGFHNDKVKRALRIYGKERHTWTGLYKVYEIIESAVGGKKTIIKKEWTTESSIKRFKHTANSPSAIGDEARHGKELSSGPEKPMHLSEARALIDTLLIKWLNSNANNMP